MRSDLSLACFLHVHRSSIGFSRSPRAAHFHSRCPTFAQSKTTTRKCVLSATRRRHSKKSSGSDLELSLSLAFAFFPVTNVSISRFFSSPVWDAMMDGHTKNGKKKIQQTTEAPAQIVSGAQYEHNPLFDDPAPQQQQQPSRKQDSNVDKYGMDYNDYNNAASAQDLQYAEPQSYLPLQNGGRYQYAVPSAAASAHFDSLAPYEQNTNFLTGPMVVRVRPDGTAVDGAHHKVLPKDDDIKEMTIGKEKMPTFQQIYDTLKNNEDAHHHHGVAPTTETPTPLSATSFVQSYRTEYRV